MYTGIVTIISKSRAFFSGFNCYGRDVSDAIKRLCKKRQLPVYIFNWIPSMKRAGLKRNAIYLIRPDGYIGFVDSSASSRALERYLAFIGFT